MEDPTTFPEGESEFVTNMFTRLYTTGDAEPRALDKAKLIADLVAGHKMRDVCAKPADEDIKFVAEHALLHGYMDRAPTVHVSFKNFIESAARVMQPTAHEPSQAERLAQLTAENLEREKKYAASPKLRLFDERKETFDSLLATLTQEVATEKIMERIKNKSITALGSLLFGYVATGNEAARDFMIANLALYGDNDEKLIQNHNCFITSLLTNPEVFFRMFPNAVLESTFPMLPPGDEYLTYNTAIAREFENHLAEAATTGAGPPHLTEIQRKQRAIKAFRPSLCRETVTANQFNQQEPRGGDPWLSGYYDDSTNMVYVDAAEVAAATNGMVDRISNLETLLRDSEKPVLQGNNKDQKPLNVEELAKQMRSSINKMRNSIRSLKDQQTLLANVVGQGNRRTGRKGKNF